MLLGAAVLLSVSCKYLLSRYLFYAIYNKSWMYIIFFYNTLLGNLWNYLSRYRYLRYFSLNLQYRTWNVLSLINLLHRQIRC
jgi:hypothetical protein